MMIIENYRRKFPMRRTAAQCISIADLQGVYPLETRQAPRCTIVAIAGDIIGRRSMQKSLPRTKSIPPVFIPSTDHENSRKWDGERLLVGDAASHSSDVSMNAVAFPRRQLGGVVIYRRFVAIRHFRIIDREDGAGRAVIRFEEYGSDMIQWSLVFDDECTELKYGNEDRYRRSRE
jgi:hypothetical protein